MIGVGSGNVPEPEMQFRFFAKLANTENNPTPLYPPKTHPVQLKSL